jgi:hypothetical protein
VAQVRAAQETALQNVRKYVSTLEEQRKLVEALERQVAAASKRLRSLGVRLAERQQESVSYAALLSRSTDIEAAHAAWQESRRELENWEAVAARFREQEKRRQGPWTRSTKSGRA